MDGTGDPDGYLWHLADLYIVEFTNKAVVEDYFVHQKSVTSERAEIDNRLEVNNITGTVQEAQIKSDLCLSE